MEISKVLEQFPKGVELKVLELKTGMEEKELLHYLKLLVEKGVVEKQNGTYRLTQQGRHFRTQKERVALYGS